MLDSMFGVGQNIYLLLSLLLRLRKLVILKLTTFSATSRESVIFLVIKTMDELIHDLREHFSFRLVVDFHEHNTRVVRDPYPLPRPKEMAFSIGMEMKKFKTVLDFK